MEGRISRKQLACVSTILGIVCRKLVMRSDMVLEKEFRVRYRAVVNHLIEGGVSSSANPFVTVVMNS